MPDCTATSRYLNRPTRPLDEAATTMLRRALRGVLSAVVDDALRDPSDPHHARAKATLAAAIVHARRVWRNTKPVDPSEGGTEQ